MPVVPGSIQAITTAIKVSAVLSGTGTRKVFPDSRSTPPNTHCTFTACFGACTDRTCFHRFRVLLGPPISEQPSTYSHHGLSAKLAPSQPSFLSWSIALVGQSRHVRDAQCSMRNKILSPNPQTGWPGYPFVTGSSPLTCPAWAALWVATLLPA